MTRRKTKKQKLKTARLRQNRARDGEVETSKASDGVYEFDEGVLGKEKVKDNNKRGQARGEYGAELFDYDPKLLTLDIRKTLVVSLIVFGALMGVYLGLR